MAGKGGGAWKVAYADFVTAMMAFFMVMWLISQNEKVKHAVASHFRNPYGQFARGETLLPPQHPQYFRDRPHSVQGEDGPSSKTEGPKTRKPFTLTLHRGDRTIVGTVITFGESEVDLDEEARAQLKGLVPRIEGKPQKIEVRGHAMRQPPREGQEHVPWQMSYTRCLNTMQFLIDQGISPERIRLSQAGAFEPYTLADDPAKAANNSRVEVYLLNEVAHDAIGTQEERERRFNPDIPSTDVSHKAPSPAPGH